MEDRSDQRSHSEFDGAVGVVVDPVKGVGGDEAQVVAFDKAQDEEEELVGDEGQLRAADLVLQLLAALNAVDDLLEGFACACGWGGAKYLN